MSLAQRGSARFAQVVVLAVPCAVAVAVRYGGAALGHDVGWGTSFLAGVASLVVLYVVLLLVARAYEAEAPGAPVVEEEAPVPEAAEPPEARDPVMCVRVLYDETGRMRVRIQRDPRGWFTFVEEHFSELPIERGWRAQPRGLSGVFETEQIALREARAEIDWAVAREEQPEDV